MTQASNIRVTSFGGVTQWELRNCAPFLTYLAIDPKEVF